MAARIGQLRLAGIGTGGTITAPTRAPSVGQQLAATGDVLTALAAGLTDDLTALDKLKSVEIEERFKRNVDERNAKLNPLDNDFEEQVSNVVEEERAAATEAANDTFGTQSEMDALQLLLKTQGEGLKTLASTFRRSAISKRGIALYEAASDEVLAQVREDPDGADLFVDAFKEKVKRLGAGVPPLALAKMALEFADDAIFAQVEGLALQRRFEEARALSDDEAGEFPPERFRTLKRRIREIETQARADDLIANADELADIDIATIDAQNVGDLEVQRERVEEARDAGVLTPGQAAARIAAIASRGRSLIKAGKQREEAVKAFLENRVTDRKQADLVNEILIERARARAEAKGEELTPDAALKITVNANARMGILAGTDRSDIDVAGVTNDPATLERGILVAQAYSKGAPSVDLNEKPQLTIARVYSELLGMTPEKAAQFTISRVPDQATRKQRTEEFAELTAELDVEERIQDDVLETGFFESDAVVSAKAQEDYLKIFNARYLFTGDEDVAKEAAIRDFRRVYGITRAGTGIARVVKNPPERMLPAAVLQNLDPDMATQLINEDVNANIKRIFFLPTTPEGAIAPPGPEATPEELLRQTLLIEAGVPTEWVLADTGVPGTYEVRFLNSEGVMAPFVDPVTGESFKYTVPTIDEMDDIPSFKRLKEEQKRAFDLRREMIEARKLGTEPGGSQLGSPASTLRKLKEKLKQGPVKPEPDEVSSTPVSGGGGFFISAAGAATPVPPRKPLGMVNNNPLNIKKGTDKWKGTAGVDQSDPDFVRFSSPEFGIRAGARNLQTYKTKHGLVTIEDIISRWAPPKNKKGRVINNTEAYIQSVSSRTGYPRNLIIDVFDDVVMMRLIRAMIFVELDGVQPYGDEVIAVGIALAR